MNKMLDKNLSMKKFFIFFAFFVAVPLASGDIDVDYKTYVFHCEGEELLCGGELERKHRLVKVETEKILFRTEYPEAENISNTDQIDPYSVNETRIDQIYYQLGFRNQEFIEGNFTEYDSLQRRLEFYRQESELNEEANYSEEIAQTRKKIVQKEEKVDSILKKNNISQEYLIASISSLQDWHAPVVIRHNDTEKLHEKEKGLASPKHFYPKKSWKKSDLRSKEGCWKTQIDGISDFYVVDWKRNYQPWNCVRGISSYPVGQDPVWNLNPLSWF